MAYKTRDRDGNQYWACEDPFPCDRWCADRGKLIPELQARRRCTLPTFRGEWSQPVYPIDARLEQWIGAAPDYSDTAAPQMMPPEPASEGCPGGWSRCAFAQSFMPYMRRRLEGGGHDDNPRIHAGTPAHILDALSSFESYEAAAAAERARVTRG